MEASNDKIESVRPELAEVIKRHSYLLDENRPEAVAKRNKTKQRTARAKCGRPM